MSMNARASMPGSNSLQVIRPTRCARATDANCNVCPWVNSRSNCPNVAGAYTPPNSRGMPPARITSKSSMQSAPAAIPAMTEVSLPAGFTPADLTLVDLNSTRSASRSDRPARSANAITGTSPAHDTRSSSSNTGAALDQP